MKNSKLNLQKNRIIKDYLSGISALEISKNLNVCDTSISRLLRKNNINIRNSSEYNRKYIINENYFDNIDSEIKAYILGLFYADGYNNTERSSVRISLQEKDIDIIELIRKEIYPNNDKPIGVSKKNNGNNLRYLDITNKHISDTLSILGVTRKKTFDITFPKWLDKNLYYHFIRGYFDGDGCLTYHNTENGNYFKCRFEIIGTEEFCIAVSNIFEYSGCISHVGSKNIVRYSLSGRKQLLNVCDLMYKNANIYMKRKYDKYIHIKNYNK